MKRLKDTILALYIAGSLIALVVLVPLQDLLTAGLVGLRFGVVTSP